MTQYGIVIDLTKCIRCRTCMVACKVQNRIPPLEQGRVEHYRLRPVEWEEGDYPNLKRIFIPVPCMNCDKPACLEACPVDAISKRPDGIVVIDKSKCIACGSCTEACPYGVPYLQDTSDKCDFCAVTGLDKGMDVPYCVSSCPGEAMAFGDLHNPTSQVSKLIASGKAKPLCPEWGTKPNVYYIPPKWYEAGWPKLVENDLFLATLAQREKDLLEPKNAAIESTKKVIKTAGILGSPFGAMLVGAAGAGLTLDYLAKRKAKVAAEEADKKQLTLPE